MLRDPTNALDTFLRVFQKKGIPVFKNRIERVVILQRARSAAQIERIPQVEALSLQQRRVSR